MFTYPLINMVRTGENIRRLRENSDMTVKELAGILGFNSPQAIYKWQHGECLPTVDNLVILSCIFQVPVDEILVVDARESIRVIA